MQFNPRTSSGLVDEPMLESIQLPLQGDHDVCLVALNTFHYYNTILQGLGVPELTYNARMMLCWAERGSSPSSRSCDKVALS